MNRDAVWFDTINVRSSLMQKEPQSNRLSGSDTLKDLKAILSSGANATGGWPYYRGKLSRLEPTCWALMAFKPTVPDHRRFVLSRRHSDGLFADGENLPANLSWSALAFLALSSDASTPEGSLQSLREALTASGGMQFDNSPEFRQNNQLKGWSWVPETFSWIEPTAWCVLALKKALRSGKAEAKAVQTRIAEGEAVLFDRVCEPGGWNFGNANAFGKNLPAHIPTTALGLLALQDKADHPAVTKSLSFVESHWGRELSGTALALTVLSLRIHGRDTSVIAEALVRQWTHTQFLGNLATIALACCALSEEPGVLAPLTLT